MNRWPRILLRFIGTIAVLCAALGIAYNSASLSAVFSDTFNTAEEPFFYPAFLIMSGICLGCYGALIAFGISLLLGREAAAKPLTAVLLFEVAFFIAVGMSWLMPGIGKGIGAATGIANGGLMFQFIILFPLWAPLAASWARKRLQSSPPSSNTALLSTK